MKVTAYCDPFWMVGELLALAPGASVSTYDPDAPVSGVMAARSMHAVPYDGA